MIWPFARGSAGLALQGDSQRVPPFAMYYPTRSAMNAEQRRYYDHLKGEIAKGRALDVGDSVSYVFCYAYEIQASTDLAMVATRMRELAEAYAHDPKLSTYCSDWAVDALIGQRRFADARAAFRDLPLDLSGSLRTDVLLSLKMQLNERPSGRDIFTLEGPKVTRYAREHIKNVVTIVDALLDRREAHEGSVLAEWTGPSRSGRATTTSSMGRRADVRRRS